MNYSITLAFTILSFISRGQQQSNVNQQLISNFGYGTMVEMKDATGRPVIHKKYDIDIKGFPFLFRDWCDTDFKLANGNEYHHAKIKLNLESNELNYLDSNDQTIILKKGIIRELYFNQNSLTAIKPLIFRNGYPSIYKQDSSNFYQVLTDGKIVFLKHTRKAISVLKNDISGETTKEFTEYIDYYIYLKNEIKELKKYKQFFLILMNDKIETIEKFIEVEKTNFKNIESMRKLIEYYNNLN